MGGQRKNVGSSPDAGQQAAYRQDKPSFRDSRPLASVSTPGRPSSLPEKSPPATLQGLNPPNQTHVVGGRWQPTPVVLNIVHPASDALQRPRLPVPVMPHDSPTVCVGASLASFPTGDFARVSTLRTPGAIPSAAAPAAAFALRIPTILKRTRTTRLFQSTRYRDESTMWHCELAHRADLSRRLRGSAGLGLPA